MPGFGAYILAGAAGGLGAGLVEQARQQRDLSMKMLERQWQLDDRAAAEAQRAARGSGGGGGGGGRSGAGGDGVADPPTMTDGGKFRLVQRLTPDIADLDDDGEIDRDVVRVFEEQVTRLMDPNNGPGLSEDEAIEAALRNAGRRQVETRIVENDGWWDGKPQTTRIEMQDGPFDGTFRPYEPPAAAPDAGATPAPQPRLGFGADEPTAAPAPTPQPAALPSAMPSAAPVPQRPAAPAVTRPAPQPAPAAAPRRPGFLSNEDPALPGDPQPVPRVGQVVDGYRFKGGDPNDAENWERVE
jgi:hypothetical protein